MVSKLKLKGIDGEAPKKVCGLHNIFRAFSKFYKIKKLLNTNFQILIHKPSLVSREVTQKFKPDRFSRFDVYWIQTDRQTPKQARKVYK